ncbi:MAG: putative NAD(P)-binding, partial [Actinomycetia bacterium]|nr:putative NAD(P)-binding [Actinomycetes bacterium]
MGGGPVALGKVRGLLAVDAVVTVVAPQVVDELAALEGVTVRPRRYETGDLTGHRLAITAT